MSGLFAIAWGRLRRPGLAVVGVACITFALLAMLAIPLTASLGLTAAARTVADLAGLGLRITLGITALFLGSASIGPPVRAGHPEIWFAHGLRRGHWLAGQTLAAAITLLGLLMTLTLTWWAISATQSVELPFSTASFLGMCIVECAVVYSLSTLCGCLARGAAGPALAVVWLGAATLCNATAGLGLDGPLAWTTTGLACLVPTLAGLDLQQVLLHGAPASALAISALHGSLWVVGTHLAVAFWLTQSDRA
ncbi:MAG: hypothetical protein AB8H79_25900 [Myxococcota bacterium]